MYAPVYLYNVEIGNFPEILMCIFYVKARQTKPLKGNCMVLMDSLNLHHTVDP